ncbi:MAG: hypothetical protein SCM11_06210 [Bacillota bacterium]|nr:hypothetical protein [Bacillota bacterium]
MDISYPDIEQMMAYKQKIDQLPILKRRSDHLRRRLQEISGQIVGQEKILAAEQADVDRLENKTLGNYILGLSRKMDERRQKEEAELVAARHRYDDLIEERQYLQQSLAEQEKQIMAAQQDERSWNEGLTARKSWIRENDSSESAETWRVLERQQHENRGQITEINEARSIAGKAGATADAMLDRLNSAEGWSTFDVWSRGGIISHVAKYNHLDAVSELMGRLKAQLRDLRTELADIRMDASFSLNEYSSGTRALDFFFDNIFTDLSVRDRVRDDIDSVHHIKGKLRQIERELDRRLAEAKGQESQASARMQQLLLGIGQPEI